MAQADVTDRHCGLLQNACKCDAFAWLPVRFLLHIVSSTIWWVFIYLFISIHSSFSTQRLSSSYYVSNYLSISVSLEESRNPLANGLLSIFNLVICSKKWSDFEISYGCVLCTEYKIMQNFIENVTSFDTILIYDQQNMWWNEVRLIMWENEEDLKCTIKLTEINFCQLIPVHGYSWMSDVHSLYDCDAWLIRCYPAHPLLPSAFYTAAMFAISGVWMRLCHIWETNCKKGCGYFVEMTWLALLSLYTNFKRCDTAQESPNHIIIITIKKEKIYHFYSCLVNIFLYNCHTLKYRTLIKC